MSIPVVPVAFTLLLLLYPQTMQRWLTRTGSFMCLMALGCWLVMMG